MKIAQSQLQLQSQRAYQQQHTVSERLRMWTGPRPEDAPASARSQISNAGRAIQQAELRSGQAQVAAGRPVEETSEDGALDPRMALLKRMVEALTGVKIHIRPIQLAAPDTPALAAPGAPANTPQPQEANFGLEYDRHEVFEESEVTQFAAQGVIHTADGQTIQFDVELSMARHYREESNESLRLGNAVQRKDPLVIHFDGQAAQLTGPELSFDLDADGQAEQFSFVSGGSGFLALDRNQDGTINDGRELFGALSGNGFADLAELDDDANGWIDENDAAYLQLKVWMKDEAGQDRLLNLQQAEVGAIFLGSVSTDFTLTTSRNEELGQVRRTGIYLTEAGQAKTVQQIDIAV